MTEFEAFPKIPRMARFEVTVTEKIDGTNAQILIPEDPAEPVLAGSRNRWITPQADNYGFAAWVAENEAALRRLGPGRHFGEWWGAGIQRRYGQEVRRFSLFQARRWTDRLPEGLPANVGVVPIVWSGPLHELDMKALTAKFFLAGSIAVPGWDKPEGLVFEIGANRIKVTDGGDQPKWMAA